LEGNFLQYKEDYLKFVEGKHGFEVQRKRMISKDKDKEELETKESTLSQDQKCKQKDQASSKKPEI
jgi:hypothetical protein